MDKSIDSTEERSDEKFIVRFADGSEERFSRYSDAAACWQSAGAGAQILDVDPQPIMSGALTVQ